MMRMMRMPIRAALAAFLPAAVACGGSATPSSQPTPSAKPADPYAVFGPLEVGADYKTWHKVTKFKHPSPTHGNRFVDIYVNDVGFAAYTGEEDFPVGTKIVKESWERDGDKPGTFPGPLFVMEKREAGYAPDHEDWYYAIHWAEPTPKFKKRLGEHLYLRSPSKRVNYCWECHENYDREVGMPPKEARSWLPEQPSN